MRPSSCHRETGATPVKMPDKEGLLRKLHEVCPEIEQLGLYPIVLGKGSRY
ncbi:MAG: hypothetical protein KBH99_01385 [Syntrophobacteraceae bacterium]|nr:hypothetical protein [Syntrophobacteraceae bacterium]